MTDLSKQAESAVKNLLEADENQLYEKLAMRSKAIARNITICSSFEPQGIVSNDIQMGSRDDLQDFGRRLFSRLNAEAFKLFCGSDPQDKKDRAELAGAFSIKGTEVTVATVLSSLLVTHLGLAPAIAAVIAALVMKRFFHPAYEEFCKFWEKNLPKVEKK